MAYFMEFKVTGICRDEGQPGAVAAATATRWFRETPKNIQWVSEPLESVPPPTKQRADLQGIVMGLEWALEMYTGLAEKPGLDLHIASDSQYAVNCMNIWLPHWVDQGFVDSAGAILPDFDILVRLDDLEEQVNALGTVTYTYIPSSENKEAKRCSHDRLKELGLES